KTIKCSEVLPALNSAFAVIGNFNLGIPYIRMEFDVQLGQILRRESRVKDIERNYCSTFLHEYVHFLQSVLFKSCQLQALVWQNLIYDIHTTALLKKSKGKKTLLPLIFSEYLVALMKQKNKVYNHTEDVCLEDGECRKFGLVDVVEGIARILEERYLCEQISKTQPPYTTIRDVNLQIFGEQDKLSDSELLDVAEVALSREYPDMVFLRLCTEIKKAKIHRNRFFQDVEALAQLKGYKRESSLATRIAKNAAGLFTSNIFRGYSQNMQCLYGEIPNCILGRPVFSSLYEQLGHDRDAGMPSSILKLIHAWRDCTPLIVNKRGELEQFSRLPNSYYEQHALVIESVIRCVMDHHVGVQYGGCSMMMSCQNSNGQGSHLPVNGFCKSDPWNKKLIKKNFCCPFGAVRRAFGLEDLLLN
ncbi:MAG: hypothetical protein IKR05_14675, partial [Prevotella sp.]|nr:hypothetical protein [Prevotella sp.]